MMEMPTFVSVAVIGLALTLVNELIIWKLWPRCAHRAASARRKAVLSTLFIDPLVAAISCPMASDLYFSFKWVLSCDDFFVLTLTCVSMALYFFSLLICHRLVVIITSPAFGHSDDATARSRSSNRKELWKSLPITAWSFGLSVGVNVTLTWLTLLLTRDPQVTYEYGYYDYYEPENCWRSMMERHAVFVFVVVLTMQVVPMLFYARLSQNADSKRNKAPHDVSEMNLLDNMDNINNDNDAESLDNRKDEGDSSVIVYTITALVCLIMTNVVRMGYTICSCHNYVLIASTLYYTNWVIAAKLPSAGLLYWTITSFQHRRGKS